MKNEEWLRNNIRRKKQILMFPLHKFLNFPKEIT